MQIGNFVRSLFAAKPAEPVAAPQGKAPKGEVGYSESLLYATSSWPKYNPDELIGLKGARVYKKMMQDEQVKAVVRFKRDAITGRRFHFEYDPEDIKDAKEQLDLDGDGSGGDVDAVVDDSGAAYTAHFDATGGFGNAPVVGDDSPVDEGEDSAASEAEGEDSALDEEQALRIRVFEQIVAQIPGSFVDALNGIASSMYNGFSVSEKVFQDIEVDGKTWIGLKKIALKPFDSFKFVTDEFGNINFVKQCWEGQEQTFPVEEWQERFVHHVQNADVDPHYGQSELREAYRAWFSKDMQIRFWNIFGERMASGFVWLEPKENYELRAGSAEYNKLVNAISNLSGKTAIITPTGVTLHVEMPKSTDHYERAVATHDKSIAKALLVPNLLGVSEQGDVGSYSQSSTQLEAFLWTLEAEARKLEETLNEQVFRPLGELNFGKGPFPRFKFNPLSETMKVQIIRLWKELVTAKAVTATDSDEDHIRDLLDFPDKGEPLANTAVNPITGLPMNEGGMPDVREAKESTEGDATTITEKRTPMGKGKSKDRGGFQAKALGVRGQMRLEFINRAAKRVDFAVIDNRSTRIAGLAGAKMTEALREGAEELKKRIREADPIKNPDVVESIELPRKFINQVRRIAEAALRESWGLGQQHARAELEKARGVRFAADELRLRDEAAEKFLAARASTIAADLSDSERKKVTNVLFNGIKNGWTIDEILNRIDDELGATVLPNATTAIRTTIFEAINEARYELFASPEMDGFVEALEFSAIIDGKTTEVCEHMDGRTYPINDAVWETYTPPLHFNCRSLLIAVTVRDTWQRSTKPKVNPADGFEGP